MSETRGVAVVTGASSGIGEATARLLARKGYQVALLARRAHRLRNLAKQIRADGGAAIAIPADLSTATERRRAQRILHRRLPPAEILVNSAGVGWYGFAADMPWKMVRDILRINIESTLEFTLLCLRDMRKRGRGHIINVGSVAGGLPSQGVALYGATKAFLDNFTTALHRELAGEAVTVSIVRPGPVRTEFAAVARRSPKGSPVPTERMGVSAEQVARAIWSLVVRPRRTAYVPGWLRFVPWAELIFGWLIDRLGPMLLRRQPV